jgi:hypothetical protein
LALVLDALAEESGSGAQRRAARGLLYMSERAMAHNKIADLNNFAPRIGLAWDVFGTGKTSVRAGYGIYYESVKADSLAQENPPYAGFGQAYNGNIANPFGSTGQTAPPAVLTGQFGCTKITDSALRNRLRRESRHQDRSATDI